MGARASRPATAEAEHVPYGLTTESRHAREMEFPACPGGCIVRRGPMTEGFGAVGQNWLLWLILAAVLIYIAYNYMPKQA